MPILLCLLLILSLDTRAAPAGPLSDSATGSGMTHRLDANIQILRMDYLEYVAALASSETTSSQRSELEELFARYQNGRIDTNAIARLTLQLIAAGIPQEAQTVQTSSSGKRVPLNIRESLWFELATAWYIREYSKEAEAALGQIPLLRRGTRVERLLAKIAIQTGKHDTAIKYLSDVLTRKARATPLDRYNLAALFLSGRPSSANKEAISILSDLAGPKASDAAMKNLAAITLGRVLLDAQDFQAAIRMLKQVEYDSVHAPEAYYKLAKAYMATKQSRKAIGLWEELARRTPTDPFIEKAMMALPPALGALDATSEAVTYIAAIQKQLEGAITYLSGALNDLADPSWIDRITPTTGQDRLSAQDINGVPAAPYALEQIASNRFHTKLIDAQALLELRKQDLPDKLLQRLEPLITAQKAEITSILRQVVELHLSVLERDLLSTRFEYAVLLDNQVEQTK